MATGPIHRSASAGCAPHEIATGVQLGVDYHPHPLKERLRFFKNSHEMLVLNILEDRGVDADELQRLRQLLEQTQPHDPKNGTE